MKHELRYLTPEDILEKKVTERPFNRLSDGYGKQIPTRIMVMLRFSRRNLWHRVYCACYSNSGTAYVRLDGGKTWGIVPEGG